MRISIVIPTIRGREESLARAIASFEHEHDIVIIQDAPSWPAACNAGFAEAEGDVVLFFADDLEAVPGWDSEAVAWCLEHDELPAPMVLNHSIDGPWDNFMDGPNLAPTHFTRIPLMSRSQWERVGPWPEDLDYCADVWVSERARSIGIETRMIHSFRFIHHWSQIGRIDTPEVLARSEQRLIELRAEGLSRCA